MAKPRNATRTETRGDPGYSDDMVAKVGRAVGQVVMIQQTCTQEIQSAGTDEEKEGVTSRAEHSAVQAIREQGLSVGEYNEVVSAADDDPNLQQRLLAAVPAEP